jgi:hypothetical protein
MGHALTVRLTPELAAWLERAAVKAGVPQGRIVREQLQRAMNEHPDRPFMRFAGVVDGARDLSARKGFSSPERKRNGRAATRRR